MSDFQQTNNFKTTAINIKNILDQLYNQPEARKEQQ